ncbi:MAG: DUF4402 domain-containing protein [Desulfocapsa sp.]|uniref:DUF4402 domain-containing protein n=1 Tax=Desulfotalea psychrophila TaxID=84980 RepID=A0ABS3AU19_9BACT|nr:DUF4402 domain-containing protein [Desulfocapsa sp.]MBN4048739.1 DUF4402 domain-containing protein [bacterium AH-315-N22]MBN4068579.1 DUF4402 domain-containing protein [Desulfotalea psychrophila]
MMQHRLSIFFMLATMLPGLFTASATLAGEVSQVTPIDLGIIDLHPSGDTIIIAAENGPVLATCSRSLITGSHSGRLLLTSTEAEHVDITYPLSATLSDGTRILSITDIPSHSQYNLTGVDLPGGGATVTISIGGKLILPGNTVYGNYSGSMTIQLNFL